MIQTYAHQKQLHEARIDIKTLERLFANVITEGTNCSAFKSSIDRYYYPDGSVQTYDSSTGEWTYGTWDPASDDLASLVRGNPPEPDWTLDYTDDGARVEYQGRMTGRRGGKEPLWDGTAADTLLMGKTNLDPKQTMKDAYLWYPYGTESSWNSITETSTT
ncbi:MAG: hypothetical protein K9M82_04605 [Deltaproteobacteria bacterium]|nr:hypothetical protein [Deltaproteobacteria bacterium]